MHLPPRPDLAGSLPPVPGATVPTTEDGRPLATWRWWEVLGFTLLGFFLGSIAAVPVALALGITTCRSASGPSELLQGAVVDVVMLATLLVWLQRKHPLWREAIGFPPRRLRMAEASGEQITAARRAIAYLREVGIGALLGLAVRFLAGIASVVVVTVLDAITGRTANLPSQVCQRMSAPTVALFALYAVVIAPVTEEFVFRGLLFRSIRDRRGFVWGAIASAIPFGLVHFIPGQPWPDVVALQLTMVVTGVGLAFVYERRGTLGADIAGHATFNLLAVLVVGFGGGLLLPR